MVLLCCDLYLHMQETQRAFASRNGKMEDVTVPEGHLNLKSSGCLLSPAAELDRSTRRFLDPFAILWMLYAVLRSIDISIEVRSFELVKPAPVIDDWLETCEPMAGCMKHTTARLLVSTFQCNIHRLISFATLSTASTFP